MTLAEFRTLVRERFGADMERATPEAVREFVAGTRERLFPSKRERGRLVLDATNTSESALAAAATYFDRVLDLPPEMGAISLWLHSVEMWYGSLETMYDDLFADLLKDMEDDGDEEMAV